MENPDDPPSTATPSADFSARSFLSLRGVLKKTYASLGGAKKFHRAQGESWDAPKQGPPEK
jgi:hypothetical protein